MLLSLAFKPLSTRITGDIGPDHSGGRGHMTFYLEVDDPEAYLATELRI